MSISTKVAIGPVTDVQVFPWVASQTAPPASNPANSIGPGMEEFEVVTKAKTEYASSAAANHARITAFSSDHTSDVSMKGDVITVQNFAYALGAVTGNSGKDVIIQGLEGTKTPYTVVAYGLAADGSPKLVWVPKCIFETDSSIKPDWKQQFVTYKVAALLDPTAVYDGLTGITGALIDNPAAAPTTLTLSSSTPASGATGIATTVKPQLVFSAALDGTTVSSATVFLVRQDTLAEIPATVSFYDAGRTTVQIAPNSNLTSGKTYQVVVVPNRVADSAGNVFAGVVQTFVCA